MAKKYEDIKEPYIADWRGELVPHPTFSREAFKYEKRSLWEDTFLFSLKDLVKVLKERDFGIIGSLRLWVAKHYTHHWNNHSFVNGSGGSHCKKCYIEGFYDDDYGPEWPCFGIEKLESELSDKYDTRPAEPTDEEIEAHIEKYHNILEAQTKTWLAAQVKDINEKE